MRSTLLTAGVALALAVASAAASQPAPATSGTSADPSAAAGSTGAAPTGTPADTSASASDVTPLLKTGVTVKDSKGATVGRVAQVVNDSSGQAASVVVKVGGADVTIPAASLTAQGKHLVAQQTKAELKAQARQPESSAPAQ